MVFFLYDRKGTADESKRTKRLQGGSRQIACGYMFAKIVNKYICIVKIFSSSLILPVIL